MQPYGDSSPSGLLWTFMGFSPAYTAFCGLAEVLGGVLLLWRRTTTLGALVLTTVMIHIVMLNFCYDVGVKLFSMHLLAMAVLLWLPDAARLADFFLLNRPVAPARLGPAAPPSWARRAGRVCKSLVVAYALLGPASQQYLIFGPPQFDQATEDYEVYEVEGFSRDGEILSAPEAWQDRWHRLVVYQSGQVRIQHADGKPGFAWIGPPDQNWHSASELGFVELAALTAHEPEPGVIVLDGQFEGAQISARARRIEQPFRLTSRGFNWIADEAWFDWGIADEKGGGGFTTRGLIASTSSASCRGSGPSARPPRGRCPT